MKSDLLDTAAIRADDSKFIHPWDDVTNLGTESRTILSSSEGIYVHDSEGNRLMDAPAGMWCVNIGHKRAEMAEAISNQVMQLPYSSPWSLANEPAAKLATKLGELSPGDLNHVFFTTGGSTAVDTALRFVGFRNNLLGKPEKKHFITRENGYHGSTFLSSSCSGKSKDKALLDLDTEHFHQLRDPNPFKRPEGMRVSEFSDLLVAELEAMILDVGAEKVAAFVAEPILASGGVVVPPDGYFKRCADMCRKYGVLVIADEVVTAFGRLGHFFSSEAVFDVVPDIITTAKGITSGYIPLGAVLVSDKLLESMSNHSHENGVFANGFTYSGHPVACAAALKNIDIIEKEKLLENARELAPYFQQQLQTLRDISIVVDVRGMGLMACVECEEPFTPGPDDPTIGERIDKHCQARGLLVRPIYNMCVMSPPLVINREQIDDLVSMLRGGLEMAASEVGTHEH
ncbi:MAG: putrescine aminotransferase [Granulosicoccus sp.]|jgi:putrescine aminotransferase